MEHTLTFVTEQSEYLIPISDDPRVSLKNTYANKDIDTYNDLMSNIRIRMYIRTLFKLSAPEYNYIPTCVVCMDINSMYICIL